VRPSPPQSVFDYALHYGLTRPPLARPALATAATAAAATSSAAESRAAAACVAEPLAASAQRYAPMSEFNSWVSLYAIEVWHDSFGALRGRVVRCAGAKRRGLRLAGCLLGEDKAGGSPHVSALLLLPCLAHHPDL
jgi:hypothetical protein